jgi:heptosyltransferase-2
VPLRPAGIRRVLVRCPNWLGDTVLALPALRALRDGLPGAEVVPAGPWVDAVLAGEPGLRPWAWPRDGRRGGLARVRAGRALGADLLLLLTNSLGSALWGRATGARWRIGYAAEGRTRLLTHPVPVPPGPVHQADAYGALLAPLGLAAGGRPTLAVEAGRARAAGALLASVGAAEGRAVGLQLGAGLGPSKLWPAERLAELAGRLEARGIPVVLLGTAAASGMLERVAASLGRRPRNLVGQDEPGLLSGLLGALAVLVTPDSGPAHVAAAVGTPVVALFGPTDPRLTAPLGPGAVALARPPPCAPCFRPRCPIDHRCLTAISVEEVLEAVVARLPAPPRAPGPAG